MLNDIFVVLSTTKYNLREDSIINDANIPLCMAETIIPYRYTGRYNNREKFEHVLATIIKKMAKRIFINPVAKYVFVGEDPENENTGLIIYFEEKESIYTEEFFKRWQETQKLLLEFQVKNPDDTDIFVLRGVWEKHSWNRIDIETSANIKCVNKPSQDPT